MASKKSRRRRSNPEIKKSFLERKEVKIGILAITVIFLLAVSVYVISNTDDIQDNNGNLPPTDTDSQDPTDNENLPPTDTDSQDPTDNENLPPTDTDSQDPTDNENLPPTDTDSQNPIAIIDTTIGVITVELFADLAPKTVENFVALAQDGFYNGLVFHRVIQNFVIQGGGFYPDGTHKQSPYGAIDLEVHPDARHVTGAIAMARTADPNSATSQFFINHGAQPNLEPGGVDQYGYTVFGVTIEGLDIVAAIASVSTMQKFGMNDWPIDDVIINSITIETQ